MLNIKTENQVAFEQAQVKKAITIHVVMAWVSVVIGVAGGVWFILLLAGGEFATTGDVYKLGAWLIFAAGMLAAGAQTTIALNLKKLSQKQYQRVTDENRLNLLETLLGQNHPHLHQEFIRGYQKGYLLETEYDALEQAMFNQPTVIKKSNW